MQKQSVGGYCEEGNLGISDYQLPTATATVPQSPLLRMTKVETELPGVQSQGKFGAAKMKPVKTLSLEGSLPGEVMRMIIEICSEPLVIKGQVQPWLESRSWKAQDICQTLKSTPTSFKVFPRRGTDKYTAFLESQNRVAFETDCIYLNGTFEDLMVWGKVNKLQDTPLPETISSDRSDATPPPAKRPARHAQCLDRSDQELDILSTGTVLLDYSATEYWVYADYQYMSEVCKDTPELISTVDWGYFGFQGRDGKDSTLWIGSQGAYTPCHYDTYGLNIVVQLAGEKSWTLFHPEDAASLYPSRVPFEESSVFSEVDVVSPDFVRHPLHKNATPYQVHIHPNHRVMFDRNGTKGEKNNKIKKIIKKLKKRNWHNMIMTCNYLKYALVWNLVRVSVWMK